MGYRETITEHLCDPYKTFELWLKNMQNVGSNRLKRFGHVLASGGAGASLEMEDNAGETIADIGSTELTLIGCVDTDDNAYDTKTITVYYLDVHGVSHAASMIYNAANSTTEVAFTDVATGLIPVTDFYCFDPAYGRNAVVSNIAAQAGDNIVIGVTGAVAGIADPTICYAHINAGQTTPLTADMYGVGSIWGSEAANQADAGYIWTSEYVTPWGEVKTGTWTFPADSSVATRFVSTTDTALTGNVGAGLTCYVNDFYRRREDAMDYAALDECRICNAAKSAIYQAIEVGQSQAVHSRHFVVRSADIARTYFAGVRFGYAGPVGEKCTLTLTFVKYGQIGTTTLSYTIFGGQLFTIPIELRLAELTEVKALIQDDAATGGDYTLQLDILEAW